MTQPVPVFVIDDELSVRRALDRLLRAYGYRVHTFASVDEFLAHDRADSPACLVVDLRMPGKTGLDLLQALNASGAAMPVVFMTGHGDVPMMRALHADAVAFLTKPFDDRALLNAIDLALRHGDRPR